MVVGDDSSSSEDGKVASSARSAGRVPCVNALDTPCGSEVPGARFGITCLIATTKKWGGWAFCAHLPAVIAHPSEMGRMQASRWIGADFHAPAPIVLSAAGCRKHGMGQPVLQCTPTKLGGLAPPATSSGVPPFVRPRVFDVVLASSSPSDRFRQCTSCSWLRLSNRRSPMFCLLYGPSPVRRLASLRRRSSCISP